MFIQQEIIYNIDPRAPTKGESVSAVFDTSVQASLRYGDYKILTGDPGFDKWVPEPTSKYCKLDILSKPTLTCQQIIVEIESWQSHAMIRSMQGQETDSQQTRLR